MPETLKGACLCGGVEYEVQDPEALGYCHCTRCQRWTGSSLAGVVVAKENFKFTKGEDLVKRYESEFAPVISVATAVPASMTISASSTSSPPA
jgi:hypothetical protein